MRNIADLKAEFFKVLGHPLRIRVLELLSESEHTVSELVEQASVDQPHLSQQLAILRRAEFVVGRREGANVFYSLADERIAALLAVSKQMLLDRVTAQRDELQRT
jgi:DNA-binding transcriptional ArsR family regulator